MRKQDTSPNKQEDQQNSRNHEQELDSWKDKVHPDTVKAVQETADQYKNVLIELANR